MNAEPLRLCGRSGKVCLDLSSSDTTIHIHVYMVSIMAKVMMYLDEATERMMRKAAESAGLPYSRWVAGLIHAAARESWPEDFLRLAGSLPDAPLAEDIRRTDSRDLPRSPW
jgi:hypothetical protein